MLLTPFQKQLRVVCVSAMLALYDGNEEDLFDRVVSMDESCVYHFDPETKMMSK